MHDIHQREDYPLLHTTLWEAFDASARLDPAALAVIDGEHTVSRERLAHRAELAAARLAAAGVRRTDRVVVKGENTVDTIVACLAVSWLGAVLVPIPRKHGRRETEYICATVSPTVLVCDQVDDTVAGTGVPILTFTELAAGAEPVPASPLAVDDVAVVGFTAGTTGGPKGVTVTSAALNYTTARWAQTVGLRPGDRVLALLPVSYLSGYAYAVHIALTRGMTVVCLRTWDPVAALDTLATHRCTWSTSITTHVIMMVAAARETGWRGDLSAMRGLSCGGAPITDDLADQVVEVLGVPLLRAYGLTECLGATMMRPEDSAKDRRRFDGFPILGTDIEAFDEKGTMLPRGTVGVGGMRGPSMFSGYYGDPEQTAASFGAAGFLMTGDLIVRDERGFVKVVGRVKDFIIRGGMNIDPVEIEDLIRTHPSVRDVAVVGYPDERLGERACACVVLAAGATFSLAAMVEFLLAAGLTKQKLPEYYLEVPEIPLSDVGKPLKAKLRELLR